MAPRLGGTNTVAGGAMQLPAQHNINDGRMRDANLASRTLDRIRHATRDLQTTAQARAAGYHPNPSAPDHWIHDGVFNRRNGYDIDRPATLMFNEQGRIKGVMLSHNPKLGAPPDLGAGAWHTHGGTRNAEQALHVWFGKPLAQTFGSETGDV